MSKVACEAMEQLIARLLDGAIDVSVAGAALLVDAGFQSVYGALVLQHELDDNTDVDLLVLPFDWETEFHGGKFDELSGCWFGFARAG